MEVSHFGEAGNFDRAYESRAVSGHESLGGDHCHRGRRLNTQVLECIPCQAKEGEQREQTVDAGVKVSVEKLSKKGFVLGRRLRVTMLMFNLLLTVSVNASLSSFDLRT